MAIFNPRDPNPDTSRTAGIRERLATLTAEQRRAVERFINSLGSKLPDGDYGDITVGGTGTALTIDAGAVTTAKLGGDITAAGKALLDDADALAQRGTLGAYADVNVSVPAGNTVANTTIETKFASTVTIPANKLLSGSVTRVRLAGYFSTSVVAPTLIGRFKVAGTAILTTDTLSVLVGSSNNLGWWADIVVIVETAGASGVARCQGTACFATGTQATVTVNLPRTTTFAIDTTAAIELSVTAQWGTASASNTITLDTFSCGVEQTK